MTRPAGRAADRQTGTYVFCIFAASRPPQVSSAPAGPDGLGPVRLLDLGGGLRAAVADAPREQFSEAALRRLLGSVDDVSAAALAHEAVVRFFFRRRAVIPLKMFTIYGNDARAFEDLRARSAKLERLLTRLEGLQEWGVSVAPDRKPRPARTGGAPTSGRAYLKAKRRVAEAAVRQAPSAVAETIGRALAAGTIDHHVETRQPTPGGPVVASAFLVRHSRSTAWRSRASRLRERLAREGWDVSITGPWPPYSFISALEQE